MKAIDVLLYTVVAVVAILVYTVLVPFLISASNTAFVITGFVILLASAISVVALVVKTFFTKGKTE